MKLEIGDWVEHRVDGQDHLAVLRVIRISSELIHFHDHSHSKIVKGTAWLRFISDEEMAKYAEEALKAKRGK